MNIALSSSKENRVSESEFLNEKQKFSVEHHMVGEQSIDQKPNFQGKYVE